MNALKQYPFEVHAPDSLEANSFTIQVRVPCEPKTQASVMSYVRGIQLKNDLVATWIRQNASDCGMSLKGGPYPIFKVQGDRNSPVTHYGQDFQLTRKI